MVKIGYVGLGAMGGSLSRHLIGKHELRVLDRNPAAVDNLRQAGAQSSADGAELARECDIIILCLPRSVDVREAIFGKRGLAEGLAPGKLLIDQTSGVPAQTAAIAAELAEYGVMMLDAPVSGGIPAAQAGKVTIIASGPDPGWNRAEPILRSMSDKVFRCSDRVGDGQALKLVNNAIGAGYRMATLELVALGRKAGLGLVEMVAALNAGPGANFTSRNMLVGLVENRSTTNFALALMIKDLNEALALGASTSAAMPITQGARSLMQIGLNLLGRDAKLDDVIELTEKLSDVPLRGSEERRSAALLAQIELATVVCNVVAVSECVAMGRRFGLSPAEMARILNIGSAWSAVSEALLAGLAGGTVPELPWCLADAEAALVGLEVKAAALGTAFLLPAVALNIVQEAIRQHGGSASLGCITFGFEAD